MTNAPDHNRLIVDAFTRQAIPFAQTHSDEDSMRMLIEMAAVTKQDRVLDVGCGPGIVACALAPAAEHVTGIDITPAMIEQATQLQQAKGLNNLTWRVGDVAALPWANESFSVVVSRFTFHHLLDPAQVLREMVRVCRQEGRVVVADVFTISEAQDAALNRMEKLRDPSHVRALPLNELMWLPMKSGLKPMSTGFFRVETEVERLLKASCTEPSAAEQVRRLFAADIGKDEMGLGAHRDGSAIHFSFPIVVLAGQKG